METAYGGDGRPALATETPSVPEHRVLKAGNTFGVFDPHGNVRPTGMGQQGVYHYDTRHLSLLELRVGGCFPLLLGSTVSQGGLLLSVDLANADLENGPEKDTLHIFRGRFLREGSCRELLRFENYGDATVDVECVLDFDADFRDVFEVRGAARARRGEREEPCILGDEVVLAYHGLDGILRRTRIRLAVEEEMAGEQRMEGCRIVFPLRLAPQGRAARELRVVCERIPEARQAIGLPPSSFVDARRQAQATLVARRRRFAQIETSNAFFNDWWNRSLDDLAMLTTELPEGEYPYAGIPWFSTPFGRDGLITALECLWVAPSLAKGVLSFLAANQSREEDPEADAQPGKILHELRWGEMANLREVPFGRYYGSVDSTPLFLVLAAAVWRRTADRVFVESILPNIEAALRWIDEWGDVDGDGFVEYERREDSGLANQGWKDSCDSVFHRDGTQARGAIALVEVQAYVYRAKRDIARLLRDFGRAREAGRLAREARDLRRRFEAAFWDEELGCYALGLDGEKRPLRVRTSNAGHALFAGIAAPARAARTAATLMGRSLFSGWAIRTLATDEVRYNPMSYHNGSVWPHDNALIARGLCRYGFIREGMRLLSGLFDAGLSMELRRMPELFCGFHRRAGEAPVCYPVACSPQAWAAAAVCSLLQGPLGVTVDARTGRVSFRSPHLPRSLREVRALELPVGEGEVDLKLSRTATGVTVEVLRRRGPVEVDIRSV